jgi:hypothetical protein
MADVAAGLTVPAHYGDTTAALPVTFSITNNGPADATGASVALSMPSGITVAGTPTLSGPVPATCSGGRGTTTITCVLSAPLAAGQTDTFSVGVFYPAQNSASPPPPTTLTATASTTTVESSTANNTVTGTTTSGSPAGTSSPPSTFGF